MRIIDNALRANAIMQRRTTQSSGNVQLPIIAVVTCMDPRLSNLPEILGLPQADIDVIRTGGPAVTEDVLGACRFHPRARNDRDYAPQPHRLRIHHVH